MNNTNHALHFSVIVSCLLLSACQAVGPNYTRPTSQLPEAYDNLVIDQNQADIQLTQTWWRQYQDETLNTLIEAALANNLEVKKAFATIEQAEAFAREVGAASLPQVNLEATGTKNRVTAAGPFPVFADNPRNNFSVALGTKYEIDFWGKVSRAKESAQAQLLASQYAKEVTNLTISGATANYYMQLRNIEVQLNIAQESLKNREQSLALTQRRLAGGIVSALDVYQAEVTLSNMKAQLAELQRSRQLVLHQLRLLTGNLSLDLPYASVSNLPVPPTPPVGLPSRLLADRPDIAQAEQQLVAQNAQIGLAKAALFPSISLTANFGGESLLLGDVLKSAARVWTAGLGLNLPIFDSGRLNAKVEQASAIQKQALINYQQTIQSGFIEVNDALVNLRQYTEKENAFKGTESSAKQALVIAENRYKSGYSSYLEVLEAQKSVLEAQTNYAQTRANRLISSVELFKALGGGWKQPNKQP